MAKEIVMPRQGNTVESCVILDWKKKEGDNVAQGDIICEVETDKAVFEVESPVAGVLLDVFFDEGDDVPVLTNIAVIGKKNENYDDLKPVKTETSQQYKEKPEMEIKTEESVAEQSIRDIPHDDAPQSTPGISPRAKKLAKKLAIGTQDISGTGPNIVNADETCISFSRVMATTPLAG